MKKGQLGIIEFKFFIIGFLSGLVASFILVLLSTKKVLSFQIPFVCGFFNKKGQLGIIEMKYFFIGLGFGFVSGLVLLFLGTKGILPFKMPFIC